MSSKPALACLALFAGLVLPAVAEVTVREEPLTLPHYVRAVVPGTEKQKRPKYKLEQVEDRQYRTVVVENEYLRVQVIPELGAVVHRAVYKPTNDDLFYYEGLGKEWYVFWESGVKASFPWAEHGTVNWGQPASWRAYRADDGAVTIALWMEFSRNRENNHHGNSNGIGGYSVCLLSQLVTLCPNNASFSITYRLVNPSPWRQGRRFWNDAFFPRHHTKNGAVQGFELPPKKTTSELILPCFYVSHHYGKDLRKWDPAEAKIGEHLDAADSIFPWDIPFGFAGVYYPDVRVNRLRLTNPKVAPGAKVYVEHRALEIPEDAKKLWLNCNHNFIELWGGTDNVFEGVDNWIGPGEHFEFTHTFGLTRGIGKVSYADETLALSVDFHPNAGQVKVLPWSPASRVSATLDGKKLPRLDSAMISMAGTPAVFGLPKDVTQGELTVEMDGEKVLKRVFPLEIPDDTSNHERIRQGFKASGEMRADQKDRNWGQPGAQQSIGKHPKGSTGRGRILYRLGRVDEALDCLKAAVKADPEDGEGQHLLGIALLETGEKEEAAVAFEAALKAKNPYAPARYYLAVLALGRDDLRAAKKQLKALIKAVPEHGEARLLAAYLDTSIRDLRILEAQDPADPRVAWALLKLATDETSAAIGQRALDALLKEPGAARRVAEFEANIQGCYMPPSRLLKGQ